MTEFIQLIHAYRLGKKDKIEKKYNFNPFSGDPSDTSIERKKWYAYNKGFNLTKGEVLTTEEYYSPKQTELF